MRPTDEIVKASLGWVNVGLGLFIGVIVAGVGAFLWVFRDKLRDARSLLTIAALLISLPLGVRLILERTSFRNIAAEELSIVAVEINQTTAGELVIYLTVSRPAGGYLED